MAEQTTIDLEQYHHLWQEALHLMKNICDDDEMVALESLTPQVVSPASWIMIAPNKFALDNIEKLIACAAKNPAQTGYHQSRA